jgi:hypothetical protein
LPWRVSAGTLGPRRAKSEQEAAQLVNAITALADERDRLARELKDENVFQEPSGPAKIVS